MSFSPSIKVFLISILWGFLLATFWDLNRVIKKNLNFKKIKNLNFILDIVFSALAVILTLTFFFIFTYGGFRAFVLAGELIGFVIYFCTITKFVFSVLDFLFKHIFKIFEKIFKLFKNLTFKIIKKINEFKIKFAIKKDKKIKKNKKDKKIKKTACFSSINECIIKKLQKYMKD